MSTQSTLPYKSSLIDSTYGRAIIPELEPSHKTYQTKCKIRNMNVTVRDHQRLNIGDKQLEDGGILLDNYIQKRATYFLQSWSIQQPYFNIRYPLAMLACGKAQIVAILQKASGIPPQSATQIALLVYVKCIRERIAFGDTALTRRTGLTGHKLRSWAK
jgi:hypothetical protein